METIGKLKMIIIVTQIKLVEITVLNLILWKLTSGHFSQLPIHVMPQVTKVSIPNVTKVDLVDRIV
jgi:hypothetical protein